MIPKCPDSLEEDDLEIRVTTCEGQEIQAI